MITLYVCELVGSMGTLLPSTRNNVTIPNIGAGYS